MFHFHNIDSRYKGMYIESEQQTGLVGRHGQEKVEGRRRGEVK